MANLCVNGCVCVCMSVSVCVCAGVSYNYYADSRSLCYSVTCYENSNNFIKIEFLAWIDGSMCAESNDASCVKNFDLRWPI